MKLEKFKVERKKYIVIGVVVLIILAIVVTYVAAYATFENSMSTVVASGSVNSESYDFKIMAIYELNEDGDYDEISTMPTSTDYYINEDKSYCTVDGTNKDENARLYTNDNGEHIIQSLTKLDKCYLFFDKGYEAKETDASTIIAKGLAITSGTPSFSNTSCESGCGESTNGLYSATDDDGTTYYFRGTVTDNYIKFAGFYWRIVRINGDGSIRIIYDGTSAHDNGESSSERYIGESVFNSNSNDNAYEGYMYGSKSASTYTNTHKNTNSSTIKTYLESWYNSYLSGYASYIDTDAGFCGDRSLYSGNGYGTQETEYGAYYRINTAKTPSFSCSQSNDLYTVSSSSKGNKALTYPIGLISVDEVAYAGDKWAANNTGFYLYIGYTCWTMSPYWFDGYSNFAWFYVVGNKGSIGNSGVDSENYVRPVINLKSTTIFTGSGTMTDPYIPV